jgi:hypothetical protein
MATTEQASPLTVNPIEVPARIFTADFSQTRPFAILSALYLLLRLPYLNYGHGTDPDAWRVAVTAHHLLATGEYFPSRLPGNPLHELLMTPLIPGGWVATNFVTALAALAGVYIFARIVAHHRLPYGGLLTIGFAFTPLLYINSIATMDYMWTLTAILGAYYCLLRGWIIAAGLCVGVAIGLRLQSFIVWLPLAYFIWRTYSWRDLVPFSLAAGGVAALSFAPVLAVYGLDFFNYYDAPVGYQDVIRLLGKEALGVFGGLGVLAGVAFSIGRLKHLPHDVMRLPEVAVWVGIVGIYFVTFLRLPHEIAYVIPVFPFGFLLMGRYFAPRALAAAVALILIAGVVDITTPSDALDLSSVRSASIGQGLILSNADTMSAQRRFVEEVVRADVPEHSVVMSGFVFPQLAVRERGRLDPHILQRDYGAISMLSDRGEAVDEARDVRYVWLLTYEAFMALRSQGYSFYLVPDAAGGTSALYDYRPTLLGATLLELDQRAPDAGAGAASTDR